jgi:predicted nucleotidyltransferase
MAAMIIERKLDSLHRCLARVRAKCPASASELAVDADLQDILVVNHNRAVQMCVDMATYLLTDKDLPVPETMGGANLSCYRHDMRLSSEQIARIKRAVRQHCGEDAEVRLFGSRVDDNARGGDIDLYIKADLPGSDAAIAAETALWADLQANLGDQHIDLLVDYPSLTQRPSIFQLAQDHGIRL